MDRRELSPDRGIALLAGLGAYSLAYVLWLLTTRLPAEARALGSDIAFLPVGCLVVFLAFRATRAPGLDERTRRAWRFLTLSFFFYWLGDILWFVSSWSWKTTLAANLAQASYVAYYPPLLLRPARLPPLSAHEIRVHPVLARRRDRLSRRADALWSALLAPILTLGAGDFATVALSDRVPPRRPGPALRDVGDRGPAAPESVRLVFLLLIGGITATLLNDVYFSVQSVSGTYRAADPWTSSR